MQKLTFRGIIIVPFQVKIRECLHNAVVVSIFILCNHSTEIHNLRPTMPSVRFAQYVRSDKTVLRNMRKRIFQIFICTRNEILFADKYATAIRTVNPISVLFKNFPWRRFITFFPVLPKSNGIRISRMSQFIGNSVYLRK